MYDYQDTLPPIQFVDPMASQRRQAEDARFSSQAAALAGKPQKQSGGDDGQIASQVIGALSKSSASAPPAISSGQREAAYNNEMSERLPADAAGPEAGGLGPTYGKPQVYDPSEAILPPLSQPGPAAQPQVNFTDPGGAERRVRDEQELQRNQASANRNNGTLGHGEDDGLIGSVLMAAL